MSAGKFDRRVEFFALGAAEDNGYNSDSAELVSQGTRKARYIPASSKEIFQSSGRETTMPVVFEVYSDTLTRQITELWTLQYDGRSYDIKGIQEVGRKKYIRIEAVAGD